MSMELEMKLVESEMQVKQLTMALTSIRNAVRSALIELEDDCYNEAKSLLQDQLPDEDGE
jgi:hypothetical protein